MTCLGKCGGSARERSNYCQACWEPDADRVFMLLFWVLPIALVVLILVVAIVCTCA